MTNLTTLLKIFLFFLLPLTLLTYCSSVHKKNRRTSAEQKYKLSKSKSLILKVPEHWIEEVTEVKQPVLMFTVDESIQLVIQFFAKKKNKKQLRKKILKEAKKLLPGSKEKKLTIKQFKGPKTVAYYFTLTDKNPESDFLYATQGILKIQKHAFKFILSTNSLKTKDYKLAMEMIKNARLVD